VKEDRITMRAGLITKGDRVYQVGRERVEMKGLDLALVYNEKGKVLRGSGTAPERSISIMIKPAALKARIGSHRLSELPAPVRDVILGKRPFHRESRVTGRLMSVMSGLDELLASRRPSSTPTPRRSRSGYPGGGSRHLVRLGHAANRRAHRGRGGPPRERAQPDRREPRAALRRRGTRAHGRDEPHQAARGLQAGLRHDALRLPDAPRMRLAERRLRSTDLSLESVAHEVGYANAASFVVAYKAFFGSTPGRARKGYRFRLTSQAASPSKSKQGQGCLLT
jgi:hypothetical protein